MGREEVVEMEVVMDVDMVVKNEVEDVTAQEPLAVADDFPRIKVSTVFPSQF